MVRRVAGTVLVRPGDHPGPGRDPPPLPVQNKQTPARGGPLAVRRLARMADRTLLACDKDVLVAWVGGSAATAGTTSGRTSTSTCCARRAPRPRSTPGGWQQPRTDFDVRQVWEVPEHVWPDGRRCFVTCRTGPVCSSGPVGCDLHVSDLSDTRSHLDIRRHGRRSRLHDPERADRPRARGRRGGHGGRSSTKLGSAGRHRRVAGNASARPRPRAEAIDFYLRFALGTLLAVRRSGTAHGAARLRAALTCADLPPTSPTGSRRWCRAIRPARCVGVRRGLRPGSTSCWSGGPGRDRP